MADYFIIIIKILTIAMQDESTLNKQQPYMIPTKGFKSLQSIMENSDLRLRDASFKIDQGGIVDHYQKIRQQQRQALAFINVTKQRKRDIFGIYQQGREYAGKFPDLVIEDHPINGKIVMTTQKWQKKLANFRQNLQDFGQTDEDGINTMGKNYFREEKRKSGDISSQDIGLKFKNQRQLNAKEKQSNILASQPDFGTPEQSKNLDLQLDKNKRNEQKTFENIFQSPIFKKVKVDSIPEVQNQQHQ